jgi:hypothetical protein
VPHPFSRVGALASTSNELSLQLYSAVRFI